MPEESLDLGRLENLLGHRFRRRKLLREALTHASTQEAHNERLEFLGDAVLGLVVADVLYARYPEHREGALTELKSRLVSREALGRAAARLGIEPYLRLGGSLGARASLPRSVLGNAFEALLGAVFLDSAPTRRLASAADAVRRWLGPELAGLEQDHDRLRAKQTLQLHAQRHCSCLPRYEIVERYDAHPETMAFKVVAELQGRRFPPAWGTTKKQAERWAAWEALLVLQAEGAVERGEGSAR